MNKIIKQILLASIFIFMLSGCKDDLPEMESPQGYGSNVTLWVVTEQTQSDGMNYQCELLAEKFQKENSSVEIYLDYLPLDMEERAAYLEYLDTRISAGTGPDIYLLPTSDTIITESPRKYTYTSITPLFPDVAIAMRSGYFADISPLYDADESLNKEALSQNIMDAGMINNSRYVLPLRFDIPVIYTFPDKLNALAPQALIAEFTISDWMELSIDLNNIPLACGIKYTSINAFSNLIDYSRNTIILSNETAESYLRLFSQLEDTIGNEYIQETASLLNVDQIHKKYPAQLDPLSSSIAYAALAQAEGTTVDMYPVRSVEGDVIATITYYGAIGSNTRHLEICYKFLRMFLEEDAQWELYRPKQEANYFVGLIENSWPVRISGSVEPLWDKLLEQMHGYNPYRAVRLTDTSIPVLNTEIDLAIFPFQNDFKQTLQTLRNNGDYSACAEKFLSDLHSMLQP